MVTDIMKHPVHVASIRFKVMNSPIFSKQREVIKEFESLKYQI